MQAKLLHTAGWNGSGSLGRGGEQVVMMERRRPAGMDSRYNENAAVGRWLSPVGSGDNLQPLRAERTRFQLASVELKTLNAKMVL